MSVRKTAIRVVMSAALGAVGGAPGFATEAGDVERGESLYQACRSCHKVGANARNGVGPHLNEIFGRAAGSVEGYRYSKSMQRMGSDGLVWTVETLDAFIENPKALVSRTKMRFAGVRDDVDRQDLMAYLRVYSDDPSNIPEAEPTARGTDHSVDPEILALQGDPEYGEYLSSECLTCHKVDGADEGIPSITAWPQEDFVIAMYAYKDKLRPHPVMQMMAGRLSAEEIVALAAYFEGLE